MSITADRETEVVETAPTQLYIAGEWRDAGGGETLAVEDPSTGETLVEVADATADDAKAALDACVAVQEEWAAHPPRGRGEMLRPALGRRRAQGRGREAAPRRLGRGPGGVGAPPAARARRDPAPRLRGDDRAG